MYLGIDIGTSSVKAVLVDDAQAVVGIANAPLTVSRPQPLWSEQNPADWWRATGEVVAALRRDHAEAMAAVRGIGISGQMHGATLLDGSDAVLRPAITNAFFVEQYFSGIIRHRFGAVSKCREDP